MVGRCAAAPVIPVEIGHRRDLLRESEFIFEIGFTGTHVRAVTARAAPLDCQYTKWI